MNIAIIPARGGSKRIARKNIKLFCGKPIIAYPIMALQQSGCVDRIFVSTDDEEIAEVAKQFGAEVPFFRPAELADDYTPTRPVVCHALKQLADNNINPEHCICIYPTSPLAQPEMIKQGLEKLSANAIDFTFSAAQFSFPIQRALLKLEPTGVIPFDPVSINMRSQDLVPAYHDAGQFYWGKVTAWLAPQKELFGQGSDMIVLPHYLVQDIDTPEDWTRAEWLYQYLNQNK